MIRVEEGGLCQSFPCPGATDWRGERAPKVLIFSSSVAPRCDIITPLSTLPSSVSHPLSFRGKSPDVRTWGTGWYPFSVGVLDYTNQQYIAASVDPPGLPSGMRKPILPGDIIISVNSYRFICAPDRQFCCIIYRTTLILYHRYRASNVGEERGDGTIDADRRAFRLRIYGLMLDE